MHFLKKDIESVPRPLTTMILMLLGDAYKASTFVAQLPPRLICAGDVPPSWQFFHEKPALINALFLTAGVFGVRQFSYSLTECSTKYYAFSLIHVFLFIRNWFIRK